MESAEEVPIIECDLRKFRCYGGEVIEQYVFYCGFCQREHRHSALDGHRVAHCGNGESPYPNGYDLVRKDGPALYKIDDKDREPLCAYVYAIQAGDGPVKIGSSQNVQGRLKALQTGNASPLNIRKWIGPFETKKASEMERALHEKFKHYRVRGEWFASEVLETFLEGSQ